MDAIDVSDIYNFLWAGEMLATAGQPSEEELAAVARAGYEVVINLGLHDAPYALHDESDLVESLGMKYIHIPVDFSRPTVEDLESFFRAMDSNGGRRIFVHCAANKRVTVFLGLFRAIKLNWGQDRAFALMHEIWEPDPVWAKFVEDALIEFGLSREHP